MCANVDQMLIVIAQSPPIPPMMLDTHIIAAVNSGMKPAIVVNKCDMVVPEHPLPDLSVYERLGYEVVRCSSVTGEGMDSLEQALRYAATPTQAQACARVGEGSMQRREED